MTGTITKQLATVGSPADGSTVTTSNTNLTGVSIGSGNTYTVQAADGYGHRVIKAGQGTTNQLTSYLDNGSGITTKFAARIPFMYSATPSANVAFHRIYAGTPGTGNLGGFLQTTTNRCQFVEGGTGTPLNVTTASGTPFTATSWYLLEYLIDLSANSFAANFYPLGSGTLFASLSGTLGADCAAATTIQSVRHGINTSNGWPSGFLSTTEGFAIGSGDWLARYDTAAPPTLVVDQPADNLVDVRGSSAYAGQTPLTFPTPSHVSGPTLTPSSLTDGLWLFDQDNTTDAVYSVRVTQADAQYTASNVTIPHKTSTNINAPLIPGAAVPTTTWA